MTDAFADLLTANRAHVAAHPTPPPTGRAARHLAVVTCMDARIDPLAVLGLAPGDAVVLRTAGGRVTEEVLRSLVLATALLDVDRVLVLAHTTCAAAQDEPTLHEALAGATGTDTRALTFGTTADQRGALAGDVQRVRSSPYLPRGLTVSGAVLDLASGAVDVVVD